MLVTVSLERLSSLYTSIDNALTLEAVKLIPKAEYEALVSQMESLIGEIRLQVKDSIHMMEPKR